MNEDYLFVNKTGAIATIFLNRPKKRNALNLAIWIRLSQLLEQLEADAETRVVVIRGVDETTFSGGADISGFWRTVHLPKRRKRTSSILHRRRLGHRTVLPFPLQRRQ